MNQDELFLKSEGDAWFARNRAVLTPEKKRDLPLEIAQKFLKNEKIGSIAEIGCSNGWRLAALSTHFPNALLAGADASAEAVAEGRKEWPKLDLRQALISEIPFAEQFDLVIVNFVLHWVDRNSLTRAVAEIDRIVKDGGHLVLGDFLPDSPCKREYHHLPGRGFYTYKQNYPALFHALGLYQVVESVLFDHGDPSSTAKTIGSGDRAVCALLKKSTLQGYPESQ